MRIDKLLADNGYGSRKDAKRLVKRGCVTVNGVTVADPGHEADGEVRVDGAVVARRAELYYMMNKPAGVITAMAGPGPTVADYLPQLYIKRGAAPVGRLDKDVTGLIIFTTDGQLAHRLASPKWGVTKSYLARVQGVLSQEDVRAFEAGLDLGGFTAQSAGLSILGPGLAIATVREGKFHQVKRMFLAVGKPVTALTRLSVGGVRLDEALSPGEGRALVSQEIMALRRVAGLEEGV